MYDPATEVIYRQLEAEVFPQFLRSKRGQAYISTLSEAQKKAFSKLVAKPSMKLTLTKSVKKEVSGKSEAAILLEFTKWKESNPIIVQNEDSTLEMSRLLQKHLPDIIPTPKPVCLDVFILFFLLLFPLIMDSFPPAEIFRENRR